MNYTLLPFKFERLDGKKVFVVNEVGEYSILQRDDFENLVNDKLDIQSDIFLNLKSKHIVTDTEIDPVVDMLAVKYRTKKSFLDHFTCLHMVVPTIVCNSDCTYCQVSRKEEEEGTKSLFMNKEIAKKTIDLIFQCPSQSIKIEFQGGEPLLNFKIVQYMIDYAEWKNIFAKKDLGFVICTNLTLMDRKKLNWLKSHKIYISTSLDGPKCLHNENRPLRKTENSYDVVIENIKLCREILGSDSVSALMTTSKLSLGKLPEIVDEYVEKGFNNIFLRSLNPYGFAERDRDEVGYDIDAFIEEYKKVLDYIIEVNKKGIYFVETFTSLLLTRILTPFSTGFVDMQSPAGVGIGGVIYNYDGNVFVSDEARMLGSMGDLSFLMGNVLKNNYNEVFNSEFMHNLISKSCLEALPTCCYCGFQAYCGADPIRNYSEHGDICVNVAYSNACKKNKEIIKHLIFLLEKNDSDVQDIFWSWITRIPIERLDGNEAVAL